MTNERKVKDADVLLGQPATMAQAELAHALRVSGRQLRAMLSDGRVYPADLSLGGKRGRRWLRSRFQQWLEAGCPRAEAWAAAG